MAYFKQYNGLIIASINIDGMYSELGSINKRKLLFQWLTDNNVDVLCLQEVSKQYNISNYKFPHFQFKDEYSYFSNNPSTAILYKSNLSVIPHSSFVNHDNDLFWTSWISIYSQSNQCLNLCSLYWSPNSTLDNLHSLSQEIKSIKKFNINFQNLFLIHGDFNSHNSLWDLNLGHSLKDNDKRSYIITDFLISHSFSFQNNGFPTHYNRSTTTESAIDLSINSDNCNILLENWIVSNESRNISISNKSIQHISDHYFIISWFKFDPNYNTNIDNTFINFFTNKHEIYNLLLEQYMPLWDYYYEQNKNNLSELNNIALKFNDIIKYCGFRAYGIISSKSSDKPWVTKKIKNVINYRHKLYNKYNRIKHKMHRYNDVLQVKLEIKKLSFIINNAKNKYYKKYQANLEQSINELAINDNKLFYSLVKKVSHHTNHGILPLRDPTTHQIKFINDIDKANALLNHFTSRVVDNDYKLHHLQFHQKIEDLVDEKYIHSCKNNTNCDILNAPLDRNIIFKSINSSKLDTACGYDKISIKLIHYGKHVLIDRLVNLFNLVFIIHHQFPLCWKLINIFPIPKPNKDNTFIKNNRPIAISVILSRLFTKCMSYRLLTYVNLYYPLNYWNCGFQNNKSVDDIIQYLSDNINYSFENVSVSEICFMDIESAYDTIWHKGLIYKLKELFGIEGNFIKWLYNYLIKRYVRVLLNGIRTAWKQSTYGILQGCPLSPILWSIYINDYILLDKNIELVAFADDISMFYCATKLDFIYGFKLQSEITSFYDWSLLWKLKISDIKCSSLTLTNKLNYRARVYTINNKSMPCIHPPACCPSICLHNNNCRDYYIVLQDIKDQFNVYNNKSLNNINNLKNYIDNHKLVKNNNLINYKINSNIQNRTNSHRPLQYYFTKEIIIYKLDDNGNIPFNNNNIILRSPWAISTDVHNTLPESVRILGLLFDSKLNWNFHCKQTIRKVQTKLYQLGKITYHPDINLRPPSAIKLYISTIRPIIEFGMTAYGSSSLFDQMELLQCRAIKLAYRLRRAVNNQYLLEFTGLQSLLERLDIYLIKQWNHIIRAHSFNLKYRIFRNWHNHFDIIQSHSNLSVITSRHSKKNYNINKNKFIYNTRYFKHSPITRMYLLMNELKDVNKYVQIDLKYDKCNFKPNPSYIIPYPSNLHFYYNIDLYNKNIETTMYDYFIACNVYDGSLYQYYISSDKFDELDFNFDDQFVQFRDECLECFTDGSCKGNPGPGGCAVVCPKLHSLNNVRYSFDHETVINYAELYAIYFIVESIYNTYFQVPHSLQFEYSEISIFTDSMYVYNILQEISYPKLQYYYQLLQKIFGVLHHLKILKINIVKVKAHSDNTYNNLVDKQAKLAMATALNNRNSLHLNDPTNPWNESCTPAVVDIAKLTKIIKTKYLTSRKNQWLNIRKEIRNINKSKDTKWPKDYLFYQSVWNYSDPNYLFSTNSQFFVSEMKFLTVQEAEIINKLRFECIALNSFNYFLGKHLTGFCTHCMLTFETVYHFLIDCPTYQAHRFKFRQKLIKINNFYRPDHHFIALYILFPHHWMQKPSKDDKEYRIKLNRFTRNRVEILKSVVVFVLATKRFEHGDF